MKRPGPSIAWPITTIDFEASSLSDASYPIEIGICRWHGPDVDAPARSWGTLVRPDPKWIARGDWNPKSAGIHGIARETLDEGKSPVETMRALNRFCPFGTLALCDGGRYDLHWLTRLAEAAGIAPLLHLGSWHRLRDALDERQVDRLDDHRALNEIAHRAIPDAEDHVRALAFALELEEPVFVRVELP